MLSRGYNQFKHRKSRGYICYLQSKITSITPKRSIMIMYWVECLNDVPNTIVVDKVTVDMLKKFANGLKNATG